MEEFNVKLKVIVLKRLKSSKGDITYIDIADKLSILKNNLGVKLIYI